MTNFATIVAVLAALPIWIGSVTPCAVQPKVRRALSSSKVRWRAAGAAGLAATCPNGSGPSPAVVLLHGCGGGWRSWTSVGASGSPNWGYVTLTVDRFGPRGITHTCSERAAGCRHMHDAYRALEFLVGLSSVDPDRVAMAGFSQGAMLALLSVERGQIERSARDKFRAAIAFYPPCLGSRAT